MDEFQTIRNWTDNDKITVLYPGGFKPITGGHLDLVKRYLETEDVNEVRLLIGPGVRNGITQDVAYNIAKRLNKNPNVIIESVKWPSPVLTAYKEIEEASPGVYTLASSIKGNDYKRVKEFVANHNNGKYAMPESVSVIELSLDIEPKVYENRDDEFNNTPISASVLRNDIINDDYKNFKTNYPENTEDDIRFVWDSLASIILNESMNNDYHYFLETTPLNKAINESNSKVFKGIVKEGGGAGHMLSPWENLDLKFGDIKNIINKSVSGRIENITEKLDGSNLMITIKENEVYLARSTRHLKNKGAEAIKWDRVKETMHPKLQDSIKTAFQNAVNDLQVILIKLNNFSDIFQEGKRWLNIELINPDVENIIPYNTYQLRIHDIREVDDKGKIVKVFKDDKLINTFDNNIKKIQRSSELNNIHILSKTNSVKIKNLENLSIGKNILLKELQTKLMDKLNLDDENTIADYLAVRLKVYLSKQSINNKKLVKSLINRWAYGIKVPNIAQLLKPYDKNTQIKIRNLDKNIDQEIGHYLDFIINIFSKLSIIVLKNLEGIAANDQNEATEKIIHKAKEAIEKIKTFNKTHNINNTEDFIKKTNYLETQLRRIKGAGGLKAAAPLEGIVFEYKGQVYKLTGIYLPILKIVQFFNFGKNQ